MSTSRHLCSALGDLSLDSPERDDSTPESLFYVLPYVGLRELLVLETVSRQLRDAIRGDVLLWQHLCVRSPLSKKLTDVDLTRLASRAKGRLLSLGLHKCLQVSDEAVETVVASNPLLGKLTIIECTKLTVLAIKRMVSTQIEHQPSSHPLTHLQISGIYCLTTAYLEDLTAMLPPPPLPKDENPQYYKHGEPSQANTTRPIDVERCPKCDTPGMVYDCPRPACQKQQHLPLLQCRGCTLCIPRCDECGVCAYEEVEETVCPEILCRPCWLLTPKCAYCNRAQCRRHSHNFENAGPHGFMCEECQFFFDPTMSPAEI